MLHGVSLLLRTVLRRAIVSVSDVPVFVEGRSIVICFQESYISLMYKADSVESEVSMSRVSVLAESFEGVVWDSV